MSQDTKTIITVLLLIFLYPVGLILMWVWTKWPVWIKILLSLLAIPVILVFLAVTGLVTLLAINPARQIQKAECVKQCTAVANSETCVNECFENYKTKTSEKSTVPKLSADAEVFNLINEQRSSKGLAVLTKDDKLCALAKIRAKDHLERGDEVISFEDEISYPATKKTYLADFTSAEEDVVEAIPGDSLKEIADLLRASTAPVAMKSAVSHGCVSSASSSNNWLIVFIGATRK